MSKYLEIADRVRAEIHLEKLAGSGRFCCRDCSVHFDTSAGLAKHRVYGCNPADYPAPESIPDLPSCPTCGGHYLYREKDGTTTCETCRSLSQEKEKP